MQENNFTDFPNCEEDFPSRPSVLESGAAIVKMHLFKTQCRVVENGFSVEYRVSQLLQHRNETVRSRTSGQISNEEA